MPKNTTGGKKAKKMKNVSSSVVERKLEYKDDEGQEYGKVVKAFGNNRFDVECLDGHKRLAHARGSLKKKKIFVKVNDVVVISLRDFCDEKCDILYVYNQKEVLQLKKEGLIPSGFNEDPTTETKANEDVFEFDYDGEKDEKDEVEDFDKI